MAFIVGEREGKAGITDRACYTAYYTVAEVESILLFPGKLAEERVVHFGIAR